MTEIERREGQTTQEATAEPERQDGDGDARQPAAEDLPVEATADRDEAPPAAEAELARYRDAMLRMQAEMENLRKRLTRDLEKSRKFALEGIMKDLLQVRDSLERGLEMADEATTAEALREGKELTLRMLGKVLADHGLEVIDPQGEPFDPEQHEAMTTQPSEEHPENTVLDVLQKGYRLHDRLLRPARVIVSRAP